jgi:hypothetical protein
MFVENTCTQKTVAAQTLSNTSPETATVDFAADGTCGDYHVGFDRGGHAGHGWALVDDAQLAIADTVIDDPDSGFSYLGDWSTVGLAGPIGDGYHWGLAAGAAAEISFTGRRAFLLGLGHWNNGEADVYVDGELERRVDTYNIALVDHRVLFDTGELPPGPHTLRVVATGTKNPDSSGVRIQLDALVVQP